MPSTSCSRTARSPATSGGANDLPGLGEADCIEFTSPINIRPAVGNPSMEVADAGLRERIRELTHARIGRGEPLA